MELGISYFGNRILKHFRTDLEEIREMGCTYVVHTYSENDQTFCKAAVADLVAATHEAGLKVWLDPWGVGRVFGGEAFSLFTGSQYTEVQIASDGGPTPAACPNSPRFREFMAAWIADAVELGADIAFWDEPHFYIPNWLGGRAGTWGCLCRHCRARWERERPGVPFPTTLTDDFRSVREEWLVDFLRYLTDESARVGLPSAVCLLPISSLHPDVPENWEKVAALPNVSNIGTDPYWLMLKEAPTPDQFVRPMAELIVELARKHGRQEHLWLQGFGVQKGREPELAEVVEIFRRAGSKNIAVWGFDACRHLSWIRPADPDQTWATIKDAFRAARAAADSAKD